MTISFELPEEIVRTLQRHGDLDQVAKEAAVVELYRLHRLTHHEVGHALGLSRFETDALLQRHGVAYETSVEEIQRESASLDDDA